MTPVYFCCSSQIASPKRSLFRTIITRLLWEQTLLFGFLFDCFLLSSPKGLFRVLLSFCFYRFWAKMDSSGEVRKQDVFILKGLKQLHFALQSACTDITLLLVSLFWQELWCYSSSSKQVLCRTRRQITDLSLNAWITVKYSKWSCIKSRGRHTSAALISHWQGTVAVKIQSVAQSTGDPEIKSLFIHPGIFNITHIC